MRRLIADTEATLWRAAKFGELASLVPKTGVTI
jgi:hypothetical protein